MVAGLVLLAVGVLVHFAGSGLIHKVLPPAVTGAVVMLIGFNLAPVVAGIYWPQDQWVALLTAVFMVCAAVLLPGFWARIAVFLALVFGYLLSWLFDGIFGPINSVLGGAAEADRPRPRQTGDRQGGRLDRLPSGTLADGVDVVHGPSFSLTFILLVLPGVIALIAENTGHVKAVAEMTGDDLDPYMGRAIGADGFATALSSAVRRLADHDVRREHRRHGRHPGLLDRGLLRGRRRGDPAGSAARSSGPIVNATPGGVLGGITVVLYGMIGLVGAKIWVENGVDFGDPVNLVGLAGRPDRRHRRRDAEDHRRLRAGGHRARHDPGDRPTTTW